MTTVRTNPFDLSLASVDTSTDNKVKAYTPTWSSSANPQPAMGASTISGWYTLRGDFCRAEITLILGAGATMGTGTWLFSVPVTCARGALGAGLGSHAGTQQLFVASIGATGTTLSLYSHNTAAQVGPATPWVWAAGDFILLNVEFPIR